MSEAVRLKWIKGAMSEPAVMKDPLKFSIIQQANLDYKALKERFRREKKISDEY